MRGDIYLKAWLCWCLSWHPLWWRCGGIRHGGVMLASVVAVSVRRLSWWCPCGICRGGVCGGSIHHGRVCCAGVVFITLAFVMGFAGIHRAGVVFVMWVWHSSWGSGVRRAGLASIVWVLVVGCAGVCHAGVVWVWCSLCRFGVRRLGVAFIALVFVMGCAGICCSVVVLVRCSSHFIFCVCHVERCIFVIHNKEGIPIYF